MEVITSRREESTQPIREKTGGRLTFKISPGTTVPGDSSTRRLARQPGGLLEMHANFLINTGAATAADLEGLGDTVRADVKSKFGVELEWEIKRIGRAKA